jgi:hypothetical protein
LAIGTDEAQLALGITAHSPAVFVHQAVVLATQKRQVVGVGGTAVGPMDHMMGMDPATAATPGESTALVSPAELTAEPGRHGSSFASDTNRTARTFNDGLNLSITGQAPSSLNSNGRAVFELGYVVGVRKDLGMDMNHHAGPIGISIGGKSRAG